MVVTRKASAAGPKAKAAATGAKAKAPAQKAAGAKAVKATAAPAKKASAKPASDGEKKGAKAQAAKKAAATIDPTDDVIPLDAEDSSADEDSEAEDAEDDDEALLAEFDDDEGADSSDEDEEDDRKTGKITASGVVKLPSSRDDEAVQARLDKVRLMRKEQQKQKGSASGTASTAKPIVLYFGRVPKSMPEDALRSYLTQFGEIKRLRLARNKHTGATKHYAFVEFEDEEVGKIVCETMHNYLLEGRLLQCHVVPKEKQHANLWIGANRKFRKVPADKRHKAMHDKVRSEPQKRQAEQKLLQRQAKRRKHIQQQGIEYDFDGYA